MPYKLFDYLSDNGLNEFKEWTQGLQKAQRAKLNQKLDALMLYGDVLYPEVLTGTDVAGIQKLRVKGNVQLRPMLTNGPIRVGKEYTLLLGAIEVGGKLKPSNAPQLANNNKDAVIENPTRRRIDHERVN